MAVKTGHFMFFYPFSYRTFDFKPFVSALQADGYQFYDTKDKSNETKYYDDELAISHEKLMQYFYPFVEDKLFTNELSDLTFNRFSKKWGMEGKLQTHIEKIPFRLLSADIHLCPFGIGFLVLRTKLTEPLSFSSAMQFAHQFRQLETHSPIEEEHIMTTSTKFATIQQWLHEEIAPILPSFYVDYSYLGKNASKMPFFEDERMFVNYFLELDENEELSDQLLFRAGQLNGYDQSGKPFFSSSNPDYIKNYIQDRIYNRWAPTDQFVFTMHSAAHITTKKSNDHFAAFYGTNFYTIILHYFYKMMLLKLAFQHSELKWEKDLDIVEELIEDITKFSSRYYFEEVSVRTEGKELSLLIRDVLRIEDQFKSIKETLEELYRVQEDRAQERQNELLFILTIFSMISGLYGMNLVIEDFKEKFSLGSLSSFTFFEWTAYILTISGIIIAFVLVGNKGFTFLRTIISKKIRARKK